MTANADLTKKEIFYSGMLFNFEHYNLIHRSFTLDTFRLGIVTNI